MVTIPALTSNRSGGRSAPRPNSPRSLTSSDVQIVNPGVARDPGLQVPKTDFTGEGLQEVGKTLGNFATNSAEIERKAAERNGFVLAAEDEQEYQKFVEQNFAEMDKNLPGGFLYESNVGDFEQVLDNSQQEILKRHAQNGGTANSLANLRTKLSNLKSKKVLEASQLSITRQHDQFQKVVQKDQQAFAAIVQTQPHRLPEVLERYNERINDYEPFLGTGVDQVLLTEGNNVFVETAVNGLLKREGGLEQAEELLRTAQADGTIDTKTSLKLGEKLTDARFGRRSQLVKGIPRDIFEKLDEDKKNRVLGAVPSERTIKGIPEDIFNDLSEPEQKRIMGAAADDTPEIKAEKEVAEKRALAKELGLSGEDADDFVISQIGKGTENERAMARLVEKGLVDQDTGDKLLSGVLQFKTLRDEFGRVEGVVLVDASGVPTGVNVGTGENVPIQRVGGEPTTSEGPTPTTQEPITTVPTGGVAPVTTEPTSDVKSPVSTTPTTTETTEPVAEEDRTLFNIVTGDIAVTGLGPEILDRLQGATGQFGINVADQEQLAFRRKIRNSRRELALALVPNDRFPQNQVEFILESTDFDVGSLKDRITLLTDVVELDRSLKTTQEQAERDSLRTSGLPQKVRSSQASNANAIRNFRSRLGVPEGITSEQIKAFGEPSKGGLKAVGDLVGSVLESITGSDEKIAVPKNVQDVEKMSMDELQRSILDPDNTKDLEALPQEIRRVILNKLRQPIEEK